MFKKVDPRQNFPEMEKSVLTFWKENKIFEKSMEDGERPTFSFYDGPPFATGLPHYGHVVASLIKDVVPRYWTMKGNRVDRRWGWDCHGLPVENLIEKELGIENKQAIEEMGIDKFNAACCGSVLRYSDDWKQFIPRVGRWVDMENDYKTMDWKFTESIWWVFSEIYKKGLVYESYKSMHLCPRCETTLSNFEVTQGYKDITDLSATVKFKLTKESAEKILGANDKVNTPPTPSQEGNRSDMQMVNAENISHSERSVAESKNPESTQDITGSFGVPQDDSNVYILAWTTTPWTLPGNVALAVGKDVDYALIEVKKGDKITNYILATDKINEVFDNDILVKDNRVIGHVLVNSPEQGVKTEYKNAGHFSGEDLVGLSYEPLFSYYAKKEDLENRENGWKIYAGDFVTTEEGTGIVHIAPAFGEDDMNLARENKLPFVQHVSRSGKFVDFINTLPEEERQYFYDKEGKGRDVKPKRNPRETDEKVVEYLKKEGVLFASENYKHSYPHCWRCDTPLLNYASSSWFVEVTKIKDNLIKNNQEVNWVPGYIKDGRFGKWLEDARDWAISRSRFWGAALPIWRCEDCGEIEVIGSTVELMEKADPETISSITKDGKEFDLHKPYIDEIKIKCPKCGRSMKIVGDVFDCWFESGSMPYAQLHYPFENKDEFEKSYPADFIAEGIDQTRGWFYTLMVLSTALFDKPAFKNVIVNGIVLAEDGQKMSKKLKNYPDPILLLEKYGADSLRYYLLTSPVMKAENLRFSEKGVDEVLKKFVLTLWNSYSFLVMNVELNKIKTEDVMSCQKSDNLLDKWILSEFNLLVQEMDKEMQNYDLVKASRPLKDFVDELSNWYLRRSRKRFGSEDLQDKMAAYQTLHYVLVNFAKVMAPFMPFLSDEIYKNLTDGESVHLEKFPEAKNEDINIEVSEQMNLVRSVVTLGLAVRAQSRIKVRMPLQTLLIQKEGVDSLDVELSEILKEELNVKEIKVVKAVEERENWGVSLEGVIRVALDLNITEDLELEGLSREVIRQIQAMRKNAKYNRDDVVKVEYSVTDGGVKAAKMFEKWSNEIKSECLLSGLGLTGEIVKEKFDGVEELELGGEKIILGIKK
ncbi:MAG: isoleucine--tRNA ligase [Candidatus Pacebacteria bacterium]|nr:isoleucine--tRNA ligase [Candidatus Paceibacterota bacterium]